ncbi:MAG TPA: ElyC/SanA/YdcF family protein [Candidatus Binatia bacterium]|nr:ElyC/SanA/YdcF family protein [Candidatus Binatia bacterium]
MLTPPMAKPLSRARYSALLLLLLLSSLVLFRSPVLTALANFLIVSDPLQKADVIAVLSGVATTRCPKAAELFRDGWAERIVLTKSYYPAAEEAFRRYGIHALEFHEQCLAILQFLHIPASAVEVLEGYNNSTADESEKLRRYLRERSLKRVLLVTSNFHTRRSRLLFRRRLRGMGVEVAVQPAAPDYLFDPHAWWTRRLNRKVLLQEYEALVFYTFRYW